MYSYGWSLDCSWLDITGLAPGNYVLEIEVNPDHVIPEVSYDNNKAAIRVTIPDIAENVITPLRLETAKFGEDGAPDDDVVPSGNVTTVAKQDSGNDNSTNAGTTAPKPSTAVKPGLTFVAAVAAWIVMMM